MRGRGIQKLGRGGRPLPAQKLNAVGVLGLCDPHKRGDHPCRTEAIPVLVDVDRYTREPAFHAFDGRVSALEQSLNVAERLLCHCTGEGI